RRGSNPEMARCGGEPDGQRKLKSGREASVPRERARQLSGPGSEVTGARARVFREWYLGRCGQNRRAEGGTRCARPILSLLGPTCIAASGASAPGECLFPEFNGGRDD